MEYEGVARCEPDQGEGEPLEIFIGDLCFEGPFTEFSLLENESGIYALLCEMKGEYELVELREADRVKSHFESYEHHASDFAGPFAVAVHYTTDLSKHERQEIVEQLLEALDAQDNSEEPVDCDSAPEEEDVVASLKQVVLL